MVDKYSHVADAGGRQGLEAWPKRTRGGQKPVTWRTNGGRKADTWRTKRGDAAQAEQGGHEADNGGQAPGTRREHIAASFFLLRENPRGNCLGKNSKTHIQNARAAP